jgi:hypothetical protein
MSRRRLIPLALTTAVVPLVALSASLGAWESPSSVVATVRNAKALDILVRHTVTSSSLTLFAPGRTVVYEAPNRTEVRIRPSGSPSESSVFVIVTVGRTTYVDAGGEWLSLPRSQTVLGGRGMALGYLQTLLRFPTAEKMGNHFYLKTLMNHFPTALTQLLFPSKTTSKRGEETISEPFPYTSYPGERYLISARVKVRDGYVVAEQFEARSTSFPTQRPVSGSIRYASFGSSPPVVAPTAGEAKPLGS